MSLSVSLGRFTFNSAKGSSSMPSGTPNATYLRQHMELLQNKVQFTQAFLSTLSVMKLKRSQDKESPWLKSSVVLKKIPKECSLWD